MNAPKNNKQGFTIIEVVLVLAIAALIFLMVFIALPALQRNQRDTARRNDASAVSAALNSYRTNNRGSYTGVSTTNLRNFVDRLDQYDKDSELTYVTPATGSTMAISGMDLASIRATTGYKCPQTMPATNATSITLERGTSRSGAVVVMLENNGRQTQIFCQDA